MSPLKPNHQLINIALKVAEEYSIFPCLKNKRPACKNGFKDATQEPDDVMHLFANPNAKLIGMPTGEPSGISVIDIDIRDGKPGLEWVEKNKHILGNTRKVQTLSDGWHYYYQHTPGLRNKAGIDGCVDIRGDGGYVIHPASPGYKWINKDEQLALFPRKFLPHSPPTKLNLSSPTTLSVEAMTELRDEYKGSAWNRTVSIIAYSAFEIGWSDKQFREFIAPICDNGSDDQDLSPIIRSIRSTRGKFDSGDNFSITLARKTNLPLSPIGIVKSADLKHRELIYGLDYIAGTISLTVAAGGVGKSMMIIYEACSIANNGYRVMLLMLEDDPSEVKRRVKACLTKHYFDETKVGENLIILTEELRLTIAKMEQNKPIAIDSANLLQAVKDFDVRVVIADPFVQTHEMNENDNGQINFVADQYRSIAKDRDISIMLVHHTRKGAENGARGENARGASSLKDAARNVRELRQLSETDAVELNIDKQLANEFICIEHTKANYTKRSALRLMRKVIVQIPCGLMDTQSVATVEPYTPLTYENLVTPEKKQQLLEMVKLARDTEQAYVENPRSGSANIYIDGARVLCLPKAVI